MKKFSFKFALLMNIFTLTLIIGGICAQLVVRWGEESIKTHEREILDNAAGNSALKIAELINENRRRVFLGRDLLEGSLKNSSPEEKRKTLDQLRGGDSNFTWLGIVDRDGTIRVGTGGLLEGLNLAGRDWFEGALKNDVFFGNAHPATLMEKYVTNPDGAPLYLLDISVPLRGDGGATVGVVGSHINVKALHEAVLRVMEASGHAHDLSVSIVNPNGEILFDSAGMAGNVDNLPSSDNQASFWEGRWPGADELFLLKSAPVPPLGRFNGLGWTIVSREPLSKITAEISQMRSRIIFVSIGIGVFFALVSLIAIGWVLKPLNHLVNEIKRFGSTEENPGTMKTSIEEVDALNTSFSVMAENVIANKELLNETQREIVRALARAGEFRDNETGNHVTRMSLCCELLSLLHDGDSEKAGMMRLASQMHDVGKIGIPDGILLKPGRFEPHESAIMENHCEIGAKILSGVETPLTRLARSVALTHHERWDGSGYPNRLAGENIPLEGRIVALCDVFDALLSARPYKHGWHPDKVRALIREEAGKQFDPVLAEIFLANYGRFLEIRDRYLDVKFGESPACCITSPGALHAETPIQQPA